MKSTDEFIIRGTLLCKYVGSGGSVVIPDSYCELIRKGKWKAMAKLPEASAQPGIAAFAGAVLALS